MNLPNGQANCHRAEISGWDASENFFVEKTAVDWNRDEMKEISLRSTLHEGSVVFFRSLETPYHEAAFPIACRVANVTRDANGRTVVHLKQLHPQPSGGGTANGLGGPASRVA